MAYLPHPQKTEGGQKEIWTADEDVRILLKAILKELQIMNLHLNSLTDEEITKEEIG